MRPLARLEVDRPAQLCELFFDIGERVLKCGAPVGAGSPLGENPLALEFQRLPLPFPFGLFGMRGSSRLGSGGLCLLLFY